MNRKGTGIAIFVIFAGLIYFLNKGEVTLASQENMRLESMAGPGYQLKSTLVLHNPNLLSSTIKTIREKFYINGVVIGILDNQLNQGIPGMKDSEFPISIRFTADDLKNIPGFIDSAGGLVTVRTDGEITYQNLIHEGKITIQNAFVVKLMK